MKAAKVGAFPPELGCSAACKTAGLGFVHHLSQSTLKLALVLVQCFSPSIVLYLDLDLLLYLAKNITENITYLMFRFRRSGLMMKCEEEMFRPIGAECLGRSMDSKMVYFTLTAIYCSCSVQYQARLMSIVKPGLMNPLTTAVLPHGPSDKQLPGVGKPLGLGLCINGLWKGNETEPYYSVRK